MAVIRLLINSGAPLTLPDAVTVIMERWDVDPSDIVRGFRKGAIVGRVTAGDDENE